MKVLKFYSNTCAPCRTLSAQIQAWGTPVHTLQNVNIMEQHERALVIKHNVRALPTLVLVDDNENEVSRIVGTNWAAIKQMLYGAN